MVLMQRANVLLDVEDAEVDRYLAKGYNLVDNAGNIVKEAKPHDVTALTAAYVKHEQEIAQLKAENEKLTAQVKKLRRELKKSAEEK